MFDSQFDDLKKIIITVIVIVALVFLGIGALIF